MKVATVRSRTVGAMHRLDANFFTSSGVAAAERVAMVEAQGLPVVSLGDVATVWDPPRFARAFAAPQEPGLPYLRPYDVFEYTPGGGPRLSTLRNDDLEALMPSSGTLLQTCSGRNLGPVTVADDVLARHALSHDMIRIELADSDLRFYVLAFLRTPTGQALLKRGKSGSVIDHITVADVQAVPVPLLPEQLRSRVAAAVRDGYAAASEARRRLIALLEHVDGTSARSGRSAAGWTVNASALQGRLDAEYYSPRVTRARAQALSNGGVPLTDLADASLPLRYKRYYVDAPHGRPILSGRQLLQFEPVNLQRVSDRSFKDPERYVVHAGMTIMAADGRAEGSQGIPALVTSDREGWLASNAIMRLEPRSGVRPGRLWLALASAASRVQIKAASYGSVVDHLTAEDVKQVIVPSVSEEGAAEAEACWSLFAEGARSVNAALDELEEALVEAGV